MVQPKRVRGIGSLLAITLGLSLVPAASPDAYAAPADDRKDAEVELLADAKTTFSDSASGLAFTVLEDGTVAVGTGGNGSALVSPKSAVTIPTSVSHDGKTYKVSAIGENAFCGTDIVSVTIPEGIQSIGDRAFKFCRKLGGVVIPASVEQIGKFAFFYNNALQSVEFARGSKLTSIGKGCFACGDTNEDRNELGADSASHLKTITLPAGLEKVSAYAFMGCAALESCVFESDSLEMIDDYAFCQCTALKSIVIPELTGKKRLGTNTFYECFNLEEVTFLADMDYPQTGYVVGTEFAYCTGVQNIYYYGTRLYDVAYSGSHGLQTFNHEATDWFTVYFYANEAAAGDRSKALGYVMVPSGTLKRDICSGLKASDIHVSENYQGGKGWYFTDGTRSTDGISNTVSAVACDPTSFGYGDLTTPSDQRTFVYRGEPIDFGFEVVDASGKTVPEDCYVVTAVDSSGKSIDVADISESGTYTVYASGKNGYRGMTPSLEIEVSSGISSWMRLEGETTSDVVRAVGAAAFKSYSYAVADQSDPENRRADYAILMSRDCDCSALSAVALAGALDAPVIFTDPDGLSEDAVYEIKRLSARNIVVVGDAQAVSTKVSEAAKDIIGVENVYRIAGTDAYETSDKIYSVGGGSVLNADWSDTCYIVSGASFGSNLAVASYAYASNSPVFLVDPKRGIDFTTLKHIHDGGFDEIVVVGDEVPASLDLALHGTPVTRIAADDVSSLSASLARRAIDSDEERVRNVVVAGVGHDASALLSASVLAGSRNGIFLTAPDADASVAIDMLSDYRYRIDKGWVVGDDTKVTASDFDILVSI